MVFSVHFMCIKKFGRTKTWWIKQRIIAKTTMRNREEMPKSQIGYKTKIYQKNTVHIHLKRTHTDAFQSPPSTSLQNPFIFCHIFVSFNYGLLQAHTNSGKWNEAIKTHVPQPICWCVHGTTGEKRRQPIRNIEVVTYERTTSSYEMCLPEYCLHWDALPERIFHVVHVPLTWYVISAEKNSTHTCSIRPLHY